MMMPKKKMSNWLKVTIGVAIALILMAIPPTRHIIIFLLPAGSGIDDLIVLALMFVLLTLALIKANKETIQRFKNWINK